VIGVVITLETIIGCILASGMLGFALGMYAHHKMKS
jgi:hypothetical protein